MFGAWELRLAPTKQRQGCRANRSPSELDSEVNHRRASSLRAAKNESSLFEPQQGCASMLRRSSAAGMEESLMMTLSPPLMSILLSNQSDRVLSCQGGQLTVGTGLKITPLGLRWPEKVSQGGPNKSNKRHWGEFLQSGEGERNSLSSTSATAIFTQEWKGCARSHKTFTFGGK